MTKNEKAVKNLEGLGIDATIDNGTVYVIIGENQIEISQYEIDYQAVDFDKKEQEED